MNEAINTFNSKNRINLDTSVFLLLEALHSAEKEGLIFWFTQLNKYFLEHFQAKAFFALDENRHKKTFNTHHTFIKKAPIHIAKDWTNNIFETSENYVLSAEEVKLFQLNDTIEHTSEDWIWYITPFWNKNEISNLLVWATDSQTTIQHYFSEEWWKVLTCSYQNVWNLEAVKLTCQSLDEKIISLEYTQKAVYENAEKFMREHKQLTDSILYAKKIQQAILPKKLALSRIFDEHFVIYLPKDIVSGDFYWFAKTNYTFLAVIDCTGHGVPGAFMTMIANMLLNEIVNEKRISEPATILSMLHTGVQTALKQQESNNTDGMDVCLIRLERDEQFQLRLTFAGAKRPLYFIRNNELFKIKGKRVSIGGWNSNEQIGFKNYRLILQPNDIIYLTTDGYVDAPNTQRRSFGSKRFKEIILQNAHLPLSEQKLILEKTLFEYQKGTLQRDDITVLAIKV